MSTELGRLSDHNLARFQSKFRVAESGCWEWIARRNHCGYGIFVIGHSTTFLAHRVSFAHFREPFSRSLRVLHRCDNPRCVNPDHLFLGTQADNVRDMTQKGRQVATPLPGELNPQAKLTLEQVEEIRRRYQPRKVTLEMLAAEFGVSVTTVSLVVNRKRWGSTGISESPRSPPR